MKQGLFRLTVKKREIFRERMRVGEKVKQRESDERIEDERVDEDSDSESQQDVDENERKVREIVRELEIEYI